MFMKRGGPPLRRQTSAERALARANQQLQSARTAHQQEDSSDNEDDINKYLSSLRKKTQGGEAEEEKAVAEEAAPKPGRKKLSLGGDISDISLTDSSEQRSSRGPVRSKFLKARPAPQAAPQPATAAAQPAAKVGAAVGASALQRSAVLAQASRLTGQYAKQQRRQAKKAAAAAAVRKSSDSEMSAPSTDSELKKKRAGSGGSAEALYAKSAKAKLGYLTDEESMSFGKDGGKFLKKKEEKKKEDTPPPKTKKQLRFAGIEDDEVEEELEDTPRRVTRSPKSPSSHSSSLRSDRLRRSPAITDSDEDMSTAELGEGLMSTSSGPLTPQSPKRRTSLRSPDTPRSGKKRVTIAERPITMSEGEEEEEVGEALLDVSELSFVPERFAASPDESEEEEEPAPVSDVVMSVRAETIMDAADFLDSESDDDDSSPRFAAVRSIDDLSSASSVPEVESEVPSGRRRRSSSPRPPSGSSGSSASSSTSSTVIRSEQRLAHYSDSDFESVTETERRPGAPQSYAADFESATDQSDSYMRTRSGSSSSEETTFTESYTARIRRRRRRRRGDKDSDKCVQTHEAGLEFHWDLRQTGAPLLGPSYGMAGVELSPIAHFAVSPEALEAVTAYSPSVVALNNMLRQQLDLTRNFMSTQRRLYDAMARTIAPDYSYTTLEDTKEYIRRNRPPTLTMEEALRQVEAEM